MSLLFLEFPGNPTSLLLPKRLGGNEWSEWPEPRHKPLIESYLVRYVWVVPTAAPVPRWRSLFACYTPALWAATVVTAMAGAASVQMALYGAEKTLGNVWLAGLCALLGLPAPRPNTAKRISPRILIISLDIFCLLVRTAFLSALASLLANPGQLPQIETQEDIARSNLDLVFASEFDQYFDDDAEPENEEIRRRRISDDDVTEALKLIANRGHYATITSSTTISYSGRAHGGARLHAAESLGGGPVALMFRHGALSSSLDRRVNAALLATATAGLPDLWKDRLAFKLTVEHEAEHAGGADHEEEEGGEEEHGEEHEEEREAADGIEARTAPLVLKHVPAAFVMLGIGAVLATLAFVGEVLWPKCKRNEKKKEGRKGERMREMRRWRQ